MHYYKTTSNTAVIDNGQGELLHWESIKLSKSLGTKFYDLCNLEKSKLPGIYRFKTGFSKEIYQYPKYSKKSTGFKLLNRLKW